MRLLNTLLLTFTLSTLCSCVVKPIVTQEYDEKCKVVKKKVELTIEQVQTFNQLYCSDSHQCKSQFLGQVMSAAIIFPISAVISGSIAVIGNSIYWLNEQGECNDGN